MSLVNPDLFGMMGVASFLRHPPFGGQSLRAFRCRRLVAIEIASLPAIGEYGVHQEVGGQAVRRSLEEWFRHNRLNA